MIVNQVVRERLETRFDFQDWRDAKRFPLHMFVLRFFLTGEEFAGWRSDNVDFIKADEEGNPPVAMATFTNTSGPRPAAFSVKAYECASRVAALDLLLDSLSIFQLPDVERLEKDQETGLGEVVFSSAGGLTVMFVRANVLVVVQNAARTPTDALPFARLLDQYLTQRPSDVNEALRPVVVPVEAPALPLAPDSVVPFRLGLMNESAAPRVWYKFFSRTGRVREHEGQTFFRANEAPAHVVEVFAVAPGDGVGMSTLSIAGG